MTHQINQAQLVGEHKTVLASSSKELKRLEIVTRISAKYESTHYLISDNRIDERWIKYNLKEAIEQYNSI